MTNTLRAIQLDYGDIAHIMGKWRKVDFITIRPNGLTVEVHTIKDSTFLLGRDIEVAVM